MAAITRQFWNITYWKKIPNYYHLKPMHNLNENLSKMAAIARQIKHATSWYNISKLFQSDTNEAFEGKSDCNVPGMVINKICFCCIDSTTEDHRTYTQRKKLSTPMFFWNDKWYKYHEITDQIISRTQWWPVRTLHWL